MVRRRRVRAVIGIVSGARRLADGGDGRRAEHHRHERRCQEATDHRPEYIPDQAPARLRRSEFAMTDTELKLIAAAAIIGLKRTPTKGYKIPAAIGTPSEL